MRPVPLTIGQVEEEIQRRRAVLAGHAFLKRLEGTGTLDSVRGVARRLAFFVLCFQDVLRLARQRTTDPELKSIAEIHEREDRGHDLWYLHDLERLGVTCDAAWLFSREHELTRDVAYSHVSEVLRASNDNTRLAVVLSLEHIGAEFFGRIIGFLERLGRAEGLKYFARQHQRVESEHEMFESAAHEKMASLGIPPSSGPEILSAIDTVFATMTKLADDLDAHFDD